MYFQTIYRLTFIVCYANIASAVIFQHGGVDKLLSEEKRTQFVVKGQKARLQWVFQTDTKIVFHGIAWTIYDRLYKNRSKLVWADRFGKLWQHGRHNGRAEYKVLFFTKELNKSDVKVTILIENVQYIHENTYVCHVTGSRIARVERSQIKLNVIDFEVTSSNGNSKTVPEDSPVTFTCFVDKEPPNSRVAWYKDNVTLSSYRENNASFTKIFSKGDEGEYECRANNTLTTVSKIVNIFVGLIKNESSTNSTRTTAVKDTIAVPRDPPYGTTTSTLYPVSVGVVEDLKRRHESAGMKIELVPIILITCSAVLVILATIVAIRLYIRSRRAKTSRNANYSVGRGDIQLPIISHESSHVNRRISLESTADTSWDDENFQSTRTGFSYRDSSDEYDESDQSYPTTFTVGGILRRTGPVQFSHIQQHSDRNAASNFLVLSDGEYESYEIDPCLLQDMQTIGEGAFGIVAKATLLKERNSSEKQIVAVKMLKVFASPEDRQDLISELKIMSRIEPHRNVVGLIGCVTTSAPIFVIIEFVANGDLLGVLRKSRGMVDTNYVITDNTSHSSLSQCQLLKMAHDVTMGMTHLSRNQVIHRDLAARNVLVGEHLECKITDFGMARDVKLSNYYRKRSRGRIPLKWTAIEALVHDKYTIQSDIWSFGILLYEIVTMGGTPYPGLGARELLRKLKSGWRMPKPVHVDTSLYEIMKKCWSSTPDDRPSFSTLAKTFANFNSGDNDYINVKYYDGNLYLDIEENSPTHSNSEETV